jgi:threonine dehydrogenase-like Zn-dependent dehydrogenase
MLAALSRACKALGLLPAVPGASQRRPKGAARRDPQMCGNQHLRQRPAHGPRPHNRQLMMAILHDRVSIAKNVNATPISLDQAPRGYEEFHLGAARKYVLDPHGMVGQRAAQ